MIQPRLNTAEWMEIPHHIRQLIIKQFSLQRSAYTDVRDMKVFSDGYTNDDLKALSLERLKEYTGLAVDDFYAQLTETIIKLQNKNVQEETKPQIKGTVSDGVQSKKRGGKKGVNNKTDSISIYSKE
jgi:hypothetical protein